jgi:hypothetical protein
MQAQPDVTALGDGRFVAVWLSDQGGPRYEVHGQFYSEEGARLGGEFTLNAPTDRSPSGPEVAALGDGRFVAIWYVDTGRSPTRQAVAISKRLPSARSIRAASRPKAPFSPAVVKRTSSLHWGRPPCFLAGVATTG